MKDEKDGEAELEREFPEAWEMLKARIRKDGLYQAVLLLLETKHGCVTEHHRTALLEISDFETIQELIVSLGQAKTPEEASAVFTAAHQRSLERVGAIKRRLVMTLQALRAAE